MIEQYRRIFDEYLREKFPQLASPFIVESVADAEIELRRPHIYHLVILDLRLPETIGADLDNVGIRGLALIPAIAGREDYPVPILMIVTAEAKRITNRPELDEQLRAAFWRNWVIDKNDALAQQLVPGVKAACEYTGIGIHIVGDESADELWPMLSPREEDILRRAVLDFPAGAAGADLRWWSVERDALCRGIPAWTKVLRGKLILKGDKGLSRERFLKFVSIEEGEAARQSAELLGSKLPHGQVVRYLPLGSRALLITEKAGPNESSPQPLRTVLKRSDPLDQPAIDRLAEDIVGQLCLLSDSTASSTTVRRLLWPYHDEDRLAEAWRRIGGDADPHPTSLLQELRNRTDSFAIRKRICHGDLHPGNVSVSEDDGKLRAYIIDPGAMLPAVWAYDVAVLEVSILLHVDFGEGANLIEAAASLFNGDDPYGDALDREKIDPHFKNAIGLILTLRRRVRAECDEKAYVLLLLDYLLVQIGGVVFGTTYNKIISLRDLVTLFQHLVRWYRRRYAVEPSSAPPSEDSTRSP